MSLFERYRKEIIEQLKKELGLENNFEVPSLEKIVINCGLGSAADDQKVLDEVSSKIAKITGQRPIITKAKAAIASFNIRKGQKIGLEVTFVTTAKDDEKAKKLLEALGMPFQKQK